MAEKLTGITDGVKWTVYIMRSMDGWFHARVVAGNVERVTTNYKTFDECKSAANVMVKIVVGIVKGGSDDDSAASK